MVDIRCFSKEVGVFDLPTIRSLDYFDNFLGRCNDSYLSSPVSNPVAFGRGEFASRRRLCRVFEFKEEILGASANQKIRTTITNASERLDRITQLAKFTNHCSLISIDSSSFSQNAHLINCALIFSYSAAAALS